MPLSPDFVTNFQKESWALFGTGMFVICLRLGAVIWKNGRLRSDDYLMMFAGCWYVLLCVGLNQTVAGEGTNFMSEEEAAALTPETTRLRVIGAKWVFVTEQALMATIWSMKGCMFIVYARLTVGLKQRQYIKALAIYTYAGYIITQICYFSMCRPFMDYFAVPPPPGQEQCASYFNVLIVQGTFNISSDIGVLLVGIPLLMFVQVPLQQKVGIIGVFGMGVFVIAAALLNKVYSTVPSLLNDSINYTSWYIREATVAVYVINLPPLWPVLRKFFPFLTGRGSSNQSYGNKSNTKNSRSWPASRKHTQISSTGNDGFEMKAKGGVEGDSDGDGASTTEIGRSYYNTSQEHIIESGHGNGKGGFNGEASVLEIGHDVTFTVEHSRDKNAQPIKQTAYQANVQARSFNNRA